MTKVRLYVDALNFYYSVGRRYEIKWIDLGELFIKLIRSKVPDGEIEKLILFASEVLEEDARERQMNYLRALQQHDSRIELCWGYFKESIKTCIEGGTQRPVLVSIRGEKKTDVNLGCRIVADSYESVGKDFDFACVVSNDANLEAPLKVKQRLRQRTILIFPLEERIESQRKRSKTLKTVIPKRDRIYFIPKEIVKSSLLPDRVGDFSPPDSPGWMPPHLTKD